VPCNYNEGEKNSLGHTASQEQQGNKLEKKIPEDDGKIMIQLQSIR